MKADRNLYFDNSRHGLQESFRVLEEGDPEATYPLCVAGGEISEEVAARYRLSLDGDGKVQQAPADVPAEAPEPAKAKRRRAEPDAPDEG